MYKMKKYIKVSIYLSILLFHYYDISICVLIISLIIIELKYEIKKLILILTGNSLFNGDSLLFEKNIKNIKNYGEYGIGKSTLWVNKNTSANIFSVDTSLVWVNKIKNKLQKHNNIDIGFIDLGEISEWGRPKSYINRKYIFNYIDYIWTKDIKPDFVLIDGRFRVSCFLHSLITGNPGTKIIFDDYTNRHYYHIVEEYVMPLEVSKNQALFIIPEKLDVENIRKTIEDFIHVFD